MGGGTVGTLGQGVGAITAADAENKLTFTATHEDIMKRIPYEDTLVHENHIVYVGDFVANKPHGEGQFFWPSGLCAVKGTFEQGKFIEGFIIDDLNVVIGRFRLRDGGVELHGRQPEDDFLYGGMCAVCESQPAMS